MTISDMFDVSVTLKRTVSTANYGGIAETYTTLTSTNCRLVPAKSEELISLVKAEAEDRYSWLYIQYPAIAINDVAEISSVNHLVVSILPHADLDATTDTHQKCLVRVVKQ